MKMIKNLFILLLFSSCVEHFEEKEVYGYYTPVDYKNNFDTIQLEPHGIYHRKVYDKNRKLLLEMNGRWNLTEQQSKIQIDGFYMNLDDDLVKFPELAKDTNMVVISVLNTHNGVIQFCAGHYPDENCYQKIH